MTAQTTTGRPDPDPENATRALRVLLAEDDTRMRQLVATTLRRDGFEVVEAKDGAELLELIGEFEQRAANDRPVDLIISDINMPILSGMSVLTDLCWDGCAIPVILITAFGDDETRAKAIRLGAVAMLDKPFDLDDLRAAAARHARR